MKYKHFTILMATLALISCGPRPKQAASNGRGSNKPKYYDYNPKDTVGNAPYWQLLRIDSARAEILSDPAIAMMPSIRTKEIVGEDSLVLVNNDGSDSSFYDVAEARWHELMGLCSQKQYDDVLRLYSQKETEIALALISSTNKLYLDYCVIGDLMFTQLNELEAMDRLVKLLEYDKWFTDCEVLFSRADGGNGYVPPHYAFLLERLGLLYNDQGEWEKVEALMEAHREAVYLLSDDALANEQQILDFKMEIYNGQYNKERVKQAFIEHRDFLVRYAAETGKDLSTAIEKANENIRFLEENRDTYKVSANA